MGPGLESILVLGAPLVLGAAFAVVALLFPAGAFGSRAWHRIVNRVTLLSCVAVSVFAGIVWSWRLFMWPATMDLHAPLLLTWLIYGMFAALVAPLCAPALAVIAARQGNRPALWTNVAVATLTVLMMSTFTFDLGGALTALVGD
jgi:hypothetical protein